MNREIKKPDKPSYKKIKGLRKAGAGLGAVIGGVSAKAAGKGWMGAALGATTGAAGGYLLGRTASRKINKARKEDYKDKLDRFHYDSTYSEYGPYIHKAEDKLKNLGTEAKAVVKGEKKPFITRKQYRLGGALLGAGLAAGAYGLGYKGKLGKHALAKQVAIGTAAGMAGGKILHKLDRKNRDKIR